jgi:hypothetical protein
MNTKDFLMAIKRILLCLMLFLFLNKNQSLCALDLMPPAIELTGEVTSLIASSVTQNVPSFLSELAYLFLKSGVAWAPTLIVGGGTLFVGIKGLAIIKGLFDRFLVSMENVINAPSRVKDIDTNVIEVDKKLSTHIESFNEWKQDLITKMTSIEANVVNTIKRFTVKLFTNFSEEQKVSNEKFHQVIIEKLENFDHNQKQGVETIIESGAKINRDMQKGFDNFGKQLQEIRDGIIDLTLHLGDVPEDITQVKAADAHLIEHVDQLNKRLEETNSLVSGQQSAVITRSNSASSLNGSGIFSAFIRPEFEKIHQRQSELEEKLYSKELDKKLDSCSQETVVTIMKQELQPMIQEVRELNHLNILLQQKCSQYEIFLCALLGQLKNMQKEEKEDSSFCVPTPTGAYAHVKLPVRQKLGPIPLLFGTGNNRTKN